MLPQRQIREQARAQRRSRPLPALPAAGETMVSRTLGGAPK
ncbi:hypothetical protein GLE_2626 [Lysobacter enzymogenes]|uniref:Uncharacterized protein n=1 Tax=Lysobacter enzymogenes TaxID=69 RepID=A0A0S2DH23_LYSEN|nr:hypothetical protein GLE_2626 [Lysobacter enzymogenes]